MKKESRSKGCGKEKKRPHRPDPSKSRKSRLPEVSGGLSGGELDGNLVREELAAGLAEHMGESALIVLDAAQLNILNQVFRPIMCGQIIEVGSEYVVLHNVNIKMSNAPEFIFPTDLVIPLVNVVWFLAPYDCSVRFSLY